MVADVTEELWEHAELQEQHETLGKDYQCLKGLYEKKSESLDRVQRRALQYAFASDCKNCILIRSELCQNFNKSKSYNSGPTI